MKSMNVNVNGDQSYEEFIKSKSINAPQCGLQPTEPHSMLFDFQRAIVKWALRLGRACVWADAGLGKTFMQLEWSRQVPGRKLILAPLGVTQQTISEAAKLGFYDISYCRSQSDVSKSITITNYEMLKDFDAESFNGISLDEAGILKNFDGKYRNQIITSFRNTPFRSAWTATPAPNDYMELGNQAEFVGAMSRTEMLSMFFVHDGGETSQWRLKGHAEVEFWKWICSWAVMLRNPSDLGFKDDGFILPPIHFKEIIVESKNSGEFLFPLPAATLQERIQARRNSVTERVAACAEWVNNSSETWLIWCNLNSEADAIEKQIDGAVQIAGSEDREVKLQKLNDYITGKYRALVTKASIFGHGLNLQLCRNVAFVGLSDSWEEYYQAVRRCWRFGQKKEVNVYIIIADTEGAVLANIKRKEVDAMRMASEMVKHMHSMNEAELKGTARTVSEYKQSIQKGKRWIMHLGDCVEVTSKLKSDSVEFSIFSPPFASLYVYSASDRDMGNSKDYDQFTKHFAFLVKELYRVLMPGRLISFHCMNLPTTKTHHGYIGIQDFRGDLIRMFQAEGFIFHSEVCIWKDPVTAMQRTKALGLLDKQKNKDSCMSRQGIPDYLVTMRKPGDNPFPVEHWSDHTNAKEKAEKIRHGVECYSTDEWQKVASPVWMDINPSDTLQFRSAREHNDERHIAPLQLEVIRRALILWSNKGDLILSPFAGIGSEGYEAVKNGRRFIGIELKESYWKQACANLSAVEKEQAHELFPVESA